MFQARDRAAEAKAGVTIDYSVPSQGAQIFFDVFGIPKDAPHVEEAHEFINYMMKPEVAAKASNFVFYANGNKASQEFLDKEVIGTQMFKDWVEKNVVPVRIDFPKEKPLTGALKGQNDRLKVTYNVARVPTFLFVEPSGEVLARCGYDTAKLRDNEDKEQPKAWLAFCDSVLKARPPKESLLAQKTLKDAVKFSRAHAMPLLILSTQNPSEVARREKLTELTEPRVRQPLRTSDEQPDAVPGSRRLRSLEPLRQHEVECPHAEASAKSAARNRPLGGRVAISRSSAGTTVSGSGRSEMSSPGNAAWCISVRMSPGSTA